MKAELFSSDFVIGLSIFLIAIVIFGIYYENLQSDISDYNIRNDLQSKTIVIADILITSSGEPEYWNSDDVIVIGLYNSGLINLTKFEQLQNIDYFLAKRLMGVGGYEIYIELKNETRDTLKNDSITYIFGQPLLNAKQAFYVERLGLTNLNGNITKTILGVVMWT